MAQEEFHEIQLNGKQLVFLFMAGTVAAVVIFLCGLMVGRNLRAPRLEAAAATAETTITDPTRPTDVAPADPSSSSTDPVSVKEDLTYGALDGPTPPDEPLLGEVPAKPARTEPKSVEKSPAEKAPVTQPKPSVAVAKAEPAKEAPAAQKPAAAVPPEPSGNGWAVQVQAVTSREEADAIARRLSAKGYPAFVSPRGSGSVMRYGIRVGKYSDKQKAEAMKAKLEKEEQFKPWVTR